VASIELQDSRRLTGPNLVADVPGAVIDGRLEGVDPGQFRDRWLARIGEALTAAGWDDQTISVRVYVGGITVFHSAPIDALYAATEVNEWAWEAAAFDVLGVRSRPPDGGASEGSAGTATKPETLQKLNTRVRALIADEENPRLIRLGNAAAERGVTFLSDDDEASVGSGTGVQTWPVTSLPDPEQVRWDAVHDVPRVMVTGTNGKTTTVRMIDAIARAAGRVTGFTCTDGIHIDAELVDGGDWSGPGGARAVLRNDRVELAILETARGGMLRRGLAVDQADAALVTNVAADHLGEWGILSVTDVASAKLTLAKAVRHGRPLVVNADDSVLAQAAGALNRPVTWIAVDASSAVLRESGPNDEAWVVQDGWIVRVYGSTLEPVVAVSDVPATYGGAAVFNIRNALGAAALAYASGLTLAEVATGLAGFDPSPENSPGRMNLFDIGGITVVIDYVHNAHGLEAVGHLIEGLAPARLGLMIGHAGDREDDAIIELAQAAWKLGPRRIAAKEILGYERGRPSGEVPEIIRREMERLGAPASAVSVHPNEVDAARTLIDWATPGDVVLLSTQGQRKEVLAFVRKLQGSGSSLP
jgi:UDP-N-acetylmuramyl tripeptide synthase